MGVKNIYLGWHVIYFRGHRKAIENRRETFLHQKCQNIFVLDLYRRDHEIFEDRRGDKLKMTTP